MLALLLREKGLGFHDSVIATSLELRAADCPLRVDDCQFPGREEQEREPCTMSWEAMLPLGIISAMIFVMGSSQYVIHTSIYGKPKHPRHDAWDRAMDERDQRLKDEYEKSSPQK